MSSRQLAKNFLFGFNNNMIKMRIDKKALFYPQKLAQGNTTERFQKATEASVKVLKGLRYDFVDREIKPAALKRGIKEVTGKNIGVKIEAVEHQKDSYLGLYANSKPIFKGYVLNLQSTLWTNKIPQCQLPIMMKHIQEMFASIFNPKITTREVAMFNKSQDAPNTYKFLVDHIVGKKELTEKTLDKFLSKKSVDEKINTLQMLRYKTLVKLNLAKAEPTIDREIGKFENSQIIGKDYNAKVQHYDSKLQILNNKLAQIIKAERAKHAKSLS